MIKNAAAKYSLSKDQKSALKADLGFSVNGMLGTYAICVGKRPFATEALRCPAEYGMLKLPTGEHPEEKRR